MAENTTKRGYSSKYQDKIDALYGKIEEKKPFQYDVNADALYQQLKDQYTTEGRLAMVDTMGQAQAMTGGYGNSYAQSVGQQTYQGYLKGLNDNLPQLYEMAQNRYSQDYQDMLTQYELLQSQDQQDYARWQDQQALAMQQVNAMLAKGVMPSQELRELSALTDEYMNAMKKSSSSGGSGGGRRRAPQDPGETETSEYETAEEIAASMNADGYTYKEIVDTLKGSGLTASDQASISNKYKPPKKKGNGGR